MRPPDRGRLAVRGRPARSRAVPPNALMSCNGVPIALNGGICSTLASSRLSTPSSWYFCEQRIEHGAGLRAVLGEHVALPDVLGPLAAGERRAGRRRRGR